MTMKNKAKHLLRRGVLTFSPIIFGMFVANILCNKMKINRVAIDSTNMVEVSKVLIGVWGTLLGFLMTAESILVAFSNGTITNEFKKTGHYMTVIFQYTQTSIKLLTCVIVFICIIAINEFKMREMYMFICFITMTFIDVLISLGILILMLRMANK